MNDSLSYTLDTLFQNTSDLALPTTHDIHIWKYTTGILCVVCLLEFLIILIRNKKEQVINMTTDKRHKKAENDEQIDFANIMNSAFLSADLYDKLKVKCHPDRFALDNTKRIIAEDIFQRMGKNRANYKILLQLKQEAEEKLDIEI